MENKELEIIYLESIIKPLLSRPSDMETYHNTDERGLYIILRVHKDDMGRIIGKQGQTAQAIRTLLRQLGGFNKQAISLKIEEPKSNEQAN